MSQPPKGWRATFADEVPDTPVVCSDPNHPAMAHKHAGVGKTWYYRPAAEPEVRP